MKTGVILAVIIHRLFDDVDGVPLDYTEANPMNILSCTGEYSKLTYSDCSGHYFDSSGCYFLEHFNQYRPCARICNNVTYGSIDDEKCRSYCRGIKKYEERGSPKKT